MHTLGHGCVDRTGGVGVPFGPYLQMRPMPGQSALSHVLAQNNHQHQQQQQHLAPQQGTAGGPAAGGRRWSGPGASFAPEQQQQQQQQDATTGPMPLYQHNLAAMRMPLSGTGGHMLTPPGLYTDGGAAASTSAAAAAPGMGMGMALPGGGSLPNTAAANSHAFSTTGASRGGLPLRKSQSAVELGNWRSMSANDMQAYEAAAAAAMAAAGHGKVRLVDLA